MTPFDHIALLVMLQEFYPAVTRAALERAFRDRPEYFAGGTLIGRHGEVLKLQDGRLFDLAFAAWTPISRWQVLDVTHAGPGAVDPFALEEGPLVPIDVDGIPPPARDATFEALAGEALRDLGASELVLEGAAHELATAPAGDALDTDYADTIAPAAATLESDAVALEGLNVTELLEQSDGLVGVTDDQAEEFRDFTLPDAPAGMEPGPAPTEGAEIPEPPPPAV